MGKPADASLRLRCVACHSTETPLWRAGPDGPKTLCNACGVRYKKGKLVLYKDDDGKLTAVHRHNATPVHVPPAPKKPSKKAHSVSTPSSPADNGKKNAVRKVPSEGAIGAAVGKKPRSRSRRANAGQLPGRYASKTLPESLSSWRSPLNSRRGSPSSPVETPKFPEENRSEPLLGMSCNPGLFAVEEPSIYQFTDPEDESIFPDMACLGLDCSADDHNLTLLPMPADPSSAEQFSFAFSGLDRDGGLEMDKPDRVEALRGLVLDRTRKIARTYETTVQALTSLCEQRYLRAKQSNSSIKVSTVEDCRNFVRAFAHEQSAGFSLEELGDLQGGLAEGLGFGEMSSGVMLSEKTAHSLAVESFKTLTDSTELAGFAEACMVELLAEDVVVALAQNGHTEFDRGSGCRVPESGLASKPIPTPA